MNSFEEKQLDSYKSKSPMQGLVGLGKVPKSRHQPRVLVKCADCPAIISGRVRCRPCQSEYTDERARLHKAKKTKEGKG